MRVFGHEELPRPEGAFVNGRFLGIIVPQTNYPMVRSLSKAMADRDLTEDGPGLRYGLRHLWHEDTSG